MSKGGKGGSSGPSYQDWQEIARQQEIATGTKNINDTFDKQFTPEFFGNIKQGYLNFANPQLDNQYRDAQKQLTYSLARTGNLDSSTRADQFGDLTTQYNSNRQQVAGDAQSKANASQDAVNSARSNLLSALSASGNAASAANSATAQASALSSAPSYSPIGDMFGGITSALAQQGQYARLAALTGNGGGGGGFGPSLFRPSASAVRVS